MISILVLAFYSPILHPVDLDRITLDHARVLEGKPVVASVFVGMPCDYLLGKTVVGAGESPDGAERVAVVAGNRIGEIEVGQSLTVVGTIRVLYHPPTFLGGNLLPGWTEIRVEQVR